MDCLQQQKAFMRNGKWRDPEKIPVFVPASFYVYKKIFKLFRPVLDQLKEATKLRERPVVLDVGGSCGDFVQEMRKLGIGVIVADPVFFLGKEEIKHVIAEKNFQGVVKNVRDVEKHFPKTTDKNIASETKPIFRSIEDSIKDGFDAMDKFSQELDVDAKEGAYFASELPRLPFKDGAFELVLAGHLIFAGGYRRKEACLMALEECLRVGKEVRIFPTVEGRTLREVPYLKFIFDKLRKLGYQVEIYEADYELYPERRKGVIIRHPLE